MNNRDLADTFTLIADLLELKGENIYKILAYRKAADSLNNLGRDVNEIRREEALDEIPGVGKAIAEKIDELLSTGRLGFLEKLRREVPEGLVELLKVPDLGPKKAALFWKSLGVTNLAELEAAARDGKLRTLPGMGEKSEAKVLAGIEMLSRRTDRLPLAYAWPAAQKIVAYLRKAPGVTAVEAAGSFRRMRSTIGDLDLLAAAPDPGPVMEAFMTHPQVLKVLSHGDVKCSVEFNDHMRAQLWVQPPERFGTALVYASGSKDHNVRLRELAQDKGLSLSDRSFLHSDGSEDLYATEEEVYGVLGLPWIPPELREDRGEVKAALAGKLPHLVEAGDMLAELHSHTTWSDGRNSVREMAETARSRGFKVLAITDHSAGLGITNGLTPERLVEQRVEIDAVQREMGDTIRLLQGSEVEIRADGSLDFPDEILASLDIVIASLHVSLRQPRAQVTSRLINAIRNPHVDIIGHPTGRLFPDREGADLDMDAVLAAAAESGVVMEVAAHPLRLDLEDIYARRAKDMGIRLTINTDAHSPEDFDNLHFGISNARRGWIEPEHVINTWETSRLLGWLKERSPS
ncbi:MAG: DNA polymerase/3'-5' exonuclease PolX [Chloroflexota bacterium]|nr:MAG: DNA polymerase/3'-5' exonuclease PolX [Chloroflexota bacterium]